MYPIWGTTSWRKVCLTYSKTKTYVAKSLEDGRRSRAAGMGHGRRRAVAPASGVPLRNGFEDALARGDRDRLRAATDAHLAEDPLDVGPDGLRTQV
jgi:hypothetical protein